MKETQKEYIYHNTDGSILGRKIYKYTEEGLKISWQRYVNGNYSFGLGGVKPGPYNLLALINNKEATGMSEDIYITANENFADILIKYDILATSPPNSPKYWHKDWGGYFNGQNIIFIIDNKDENLVYFERLAKKLVNIATSVRYLTLEIPEDIDNKECISNLISRADKIKPLRKIKDISLHINEKGKPIKILENFKIMLKKLNINIAYNSLAGPEFTGDIPLLPSERDFENYMLTYLKSESIKLNINFNKDDIKDYVWAVAAENEYNPIVSWLDSLILPEDKNKTLHIEKYFNALQFAEEEKENRPMYFILFKKWLIQGIALQFNTMKNPIGAVGVLGLQSEKQGIGKTSFFKKLVAESIYFKDSVSVDPESRDSVRKATSVFIAELGELESTLKKDLPRLKGFLTEAYDKYRIPFAVNESSNPRRTSFCFTCNSDDFLKEVENRRFWTLPIINVDLNALDDIDTNFLWAEAYSIYLKNPKAYLPTPEEQQWILDNNKNKFRYISGIEQVLRDKLNFDLEASQWFYWTLTELGERFFPTKPEIYNQLGKILQQGLGYKNDKSQLKHFRRLSKGMQYYLPLSHGKDDYNPFEHDSFND